LNLAGAGLHSLLTQQKTFFHDANEVATNFDRIHQQYDSSDYWPGTKSQLTTTRGSELYREKMELIHTVYRSSTALLNLEKALEPLRETIAEIGPHIEGIAKERNTIVIDLDSYRRRVKAAREKRETMEVGTAVQSELSSSSDCLLVLTYDTETRKGQHSGVQRQRK
jgi:hypothetical protein